MKDKKNEIDMIKTSDTSKTIDRELSLSFEGVGRNKTNTESVRLENWPKFPCVSEVRPREQGEGRRAFLFALYNFLKWFVHKFLTAV